MAAKPKLDTSQWNDVRTRWEGDERKGFPWLIDEMALPVSGEAVRLRAKAEGWAKLASKLGETETKLAKPSKTKLADKAAPVQRNTNKSENIPASAVEEEKRGQGRPTKYRPEFDEYAYRLCLLNVTDKELAEAFEVTESTIYEWKNVHPSFSEAILNGKVKADAEVAFSSFKSATGGHFIETDQLIGDTVVTLKRQLPPDVQAQRLWLFNRRPKEWRDKVVVEADVNLNVFPPKEVLDAIYEKALAEAAQMEEMLIGRRERLGAIIEHDEDVD